MLTTIQEINSALVDLQSEMPEVEKNAHYIAAKSILKGLIAGFASDSEPKPEAPAEVQASES